MGFVSFVVIIRDSLIAKFIRILKKRQNVLIILISSSRFDKCADPRSFYRIFFS